MLQTMKLFPIKAFKAKALLHTTIPNNLQFRNQNTNKIKVRGRLIKGIPLPIFLLKKYMGSSIGHIRG